MSIRMHLFCDNVGTYQLGKWHLIVVQTPTHEKPVMAPPTEGEDVMLHVIGPGREAVVWCGKAVVLHEQLEREEGFEHHCDFCDELSEME